MRTLTVPKRLLLPALVFMGMFAAPTAVVGQASAACTALPTDRGTVTATVTAPAAATYRVWSRIKTADATKNSFYMQIDQTTCNVVVGGSNITANTWTWVDYQAGVSTNKINATLAAGAHTITMAGKDDNVQVDRVILTQDTTCVPTGTGDNCANPPDTTDPVVSITAPANNATISTTTTATANATDDVAVAKVEFYVDGVLKATDTATPYNYSIVPGSFTTGAHVLTAIAYDTAATPNSATSAAVNFTIPDATPPVVSAVASGSITQTGATVTWTTDEVADSQVEYGTTTAYGSSTTLNTSQVTSHSVGVTGLSASTLYHYRVKSKNAAGLLTTSPDATFTTLAPAPDTTKPTVSMTAPANGTTVTGTAATVSATATDNVGVAGVQFKLDGVNLGTEDTTGTANVYSISWDTTTATTGTHTLTAFARDAAGNTQLSAAFTVTVNNAPYIAEDINKDHKVDLADFSILAANFGKTAAASTNPRADIGNNGVVDLADFSRLAAKYGTTQ